MSIDCVLRIGNYSKLHKTTVINLPLTIQWHLVFSIVCYHLSLKHRKSSQLNNLSCKLSNLKCFSLSLIRHTIVYDNYILPLLHRMSQLEKLTLSLIVGDRTSFMDGENLISNIFSKMSHLHIFIFNILLA